MREMDRGELGTAGERMVQLMWENLHTENRRSLLSCPNLTQGCTARLVSMLFGNQSSREKGYGASCRSAEPSSS